MSWRISIIILPLNINRQRKADNLFLLTSFNHIREERYLWIFDPFDGVANFQAGIPVWGLSLALLENFWPILGAFYMPVTGDLFHAVAGQKRLSGQKANPGIYPRDDQ